MEFQECVRDRRSVRRFMDRAVPHALIEAIVETASFAPSWKNSQTTRYLILEDAAQKQMLANECVMGFAPNQATILHAPALILVTTIKNRSGYERDGTYSTGKGTHWESFDAGIAAQTLCLAAHEQGLGSVILGIFDEERVKEALGIPQEQALSALIAIGWPAEAPVAPKRKSVQDLLTYWGA